MSLPVDQPPGKPILISTISELQKWREEQAKAQIHFIPTMGALHAGHASLIAEAKRLSSSPNGEQDGEQESVRSSALSSVPSKTIVSIFVNPTQFGPQEDFGRYPRTLEKDLDLCAKSRVDAVFCPAVDEIFPEPYSTFVEETLLSQPLCGRFRPGHFRGVTTIVLKLFNLVQPHHAYFGLKDAQQFYVIRKMVSDLHLGIKLHPVATLRETDGLAMSSRNVYLTPIEREIAPYLYRVLGQTRQKLMALNARTQVSSESECTKVTNAPALADPNETSLAQQRILDEARRELEDSGFRVQYIDAIRESDFQPWKVELGEPGLIAAAAYLGQTRLIDNVKLPK